MENGNTFNAIKTRTGVIYFDKIRKLEWLSVGDYGKEKNLKADFLELKNRIEGVAHKDVSLSDKWVITVSTQKGCQCFCDFCDVPKVGFHGNCTIDDFEFMLSEALRREHCHKTARLNIHFARMGEPSFNPDVIPFVRDHLDDIVNNYIEADTIHPVISTMMPIANPKLYRFLLDWCQLKKERNGEAGLQLSIQSTDETQRHEQFFGCAMPLKQISRLADKLPPPMGRKYTLNFAVTEKTILDAKVLTSLFDKENWLVKITPIHETKAARENGFDVTSAYEKYDVYQKFEEPLLADGWDVIVFVPSKEEDEDRITCGNALLSDFKRVRQ